MPKQLQMTQKISDAISRSTDGSVDPSTVAVFECAAFNTLPITKKGTLFQGATATEQTLLQMATYLNTGTNFVPLHTLHDQGENLPVGRVFSGQVVPDANGMAELRTLFYLPLTETDLIQKLDTGVIDEVSVGLKTQHMNCSECGWDYLGADSTFENLWGQHCINDHQIGEAGVHLILSGMDRFMELSLVSLGAAKNAKIMSRTKSLMGEANYNLQLASSGIAPEATILFSTITKPKELSMDLTQLVAELTNAKAANQVNEVNLAAQKTQVDTLTAANADLLTQNTTLKAQADVSKVPALEAQLAEAQTSLTAAIGFVRKEADRISVAANLALPVAEATLEVLTAAIETGRAKLQETIPVGGRSLNASAGTGNAGATTSNSSFKTK